MRLPGHHLGHARSRGAIGVRFDDLISSILSVFGMCYSFLMMKLPGYNLAHAVSRGAVGCTHSIDRLFQGENFPGRWRW